jgi:type II secretory pathway component PulF
VAAVRSGIIFGFVALAAFVVLTLLQLYGVNLLAVLLIGMAAGVVAASEARRGGVGRGLTAGIIGGVITLIGSIFVGIVIVTFFRAQINLWLAGLPFVDALPVVGDTVTDTIDQVNQRADPWLRGGGVVLGGCLGVINLLLMATGGALGGAVRRR